MKSILKLPLAGCLRIAANVEALAFVVAIEERQMNIAQKPNSITQLSL
jgi:hypothetical protein